VKSTLAMQVELVAENTHTVVWIPASLNVRPGMTLTVDDRTWEVLHAYPICKQAFEGIKTDWKVGGLQ